MDRMDEADLCDIETELYLQPCPQLRSQDRVLRVFFFSSRSRHTRCYRDWSSDVCSSDLWRGRRRTCGSASVRRWTRTSPRSMWGTAREPRIRSWSWSPRSTRTATPVPIAARRGLLTHPRWPGPRGGDGESRVLLLEHGQALRPVPCVHRRRAEEPGGTQAAPREGGGHRRVEGRRRVPALPQGPRWPQRGQAGGVRDEGGAASRLRPGVPRPVRVRGC